MVFTALLLPSDIFLSFYFSFLSYNHSCYSDIFINLKAHKDGVLRTQFNVKVRQQLQNDFRRAVSFDVDPRGRPKRVGSVVEELIADYIGRVFSRKEVHAELTRLRKSQP